MRAWRLIGGLDAPGKRALPAGELFHPVTLAALALLVVNDRVLKGALPGAVTGKLSDVAGLASFPLVLTAAVDSLLWIVRAPVDFTLRRWKLAVAIVLTGAGFAAIKLSSDAAAAAAGVLARVFGHAAIVVDPTDLVALPALAVAWAVGRAELRRVPLGRVEWIARRVRRGADVTHALDDVGGPRTELDALRDALVAWARGGPSQPAAEALEWRRR